MGKHVTDNKARELVLVFFSGLAGKVMFFCLAIVSVTGFKKSQSLEEMQKE